MAADWGGESRGGYFWRRSRWTGTLMLRHLASVGFAALLDASIWGLDA